MAVLFLQGPLGPFFKRLVLALRGEGVTAYKINFNGGDDWYSRSTGAVPFRGKPDDWPDFLRAFIEKHSVKTVCVYGDCRLYHRQARAVCQQMDVQFFAFEEGYIRPNHLTFERDGVNGYSGITADSIARWQDKEIEPELAIGAHLWNRVRYAAFYYNAAALKAWRYPHYHHHRSFSPLYEGTCWHLAAARHYLYKVTERGLLARLLGKYDGRYFLMPLQVHNDAQIQFHSPYENIQQCIEELVASFAQHGRKEDCLVFKHHPMDRGHCHYGRLIAGLRKRYQLGDRLQYCHDQHLPTMLDHCRGVLTINSTTALQAFYHKAPVKVLGDAFYDIPGLCNQKPLDAFWQAPDPVDHDLFLRFRNFLSHNGQINGSFYRYYGASMRKIIAAMRQAGIF
ncbi:capsule biosynthesis protein [Thalassolituus sp. LLYu03]|uniref:capsule biosynthesis protein n=1 Tax=Thalassolituus sp. LLYu03 TaxID=3421656 RepID=UPI003D2A3EE3